jgi:proteasome lid subunit RPN8/RPN11
LSTRSDQQSTFGLPLKNQNEILELVRSALPDEVCGLVYDGVAIAVPNVHDEPQRNFLMEPDRQEWLLSTLGWPEALWHSHPQGNRHLSDSDVAMAHLAGIPSVLVTPDGWVGVFYPEEP